MSKKILYHGTNNADKIIKSGFRLSGISLYGTGVYFLQNKSSTKSYGKEIIKAQVNVRKPFTFSKEQNKLYSKLYKKYKEKHSSFPKKDAINELHRKYGYDALKFTDFSISRRGATAWVIFNPKRIKVIGVVN